jgi:hypothetical protein
LNCGKEAIGTHTNPNWTLLSRTRSSLNVAKSFFSVSVVQRRDIVNNVFEVSNDSRPPALQNILEKGVRELGANRLIDSRIGVPGQLACNPRVILGDSGQQSDLHRFKFAFCWSISGFTPYIQTSIEPVDRSVVTSVGLMTPTLMF